MDFLETRLIDMVQKQSVAFILQDLKCVKCRGVSIIFFPSRRDHSRLWNSWLGLFKLEFISGVFITAEVVQ